MDAIPPLGGNAAGAGLAISGGKKLINGKMLRWAGRAKQAVAHKIKAAACSLDGAIAGGTESTSAQMLRGCVAMLQKADETKNEHQFRMRLMHIEEQRTKLRKM